MKPILIVGAVCFVLIGGALWLDVTKETRQLELIASGECEAAQEALYTPPPTYICVAENSGGGCSVSVPVQDPPYMRTLWECAESSFWRRSE